MAVIVIDGPEKAGKTTLINALVYTLRSFHKINAERVHWGPVNPDDRVYSDVLAKHTNDLSKVWVWDRSWASEHVYGQMLGRGRRLAMDPWLGEWLHGRAVQSTGMRVILTGPDSNTMERLRNDTDIKVPAAMERVHFINYGHKFEWTILDNRHDEESLAWCVKEILQRFFNMPRIPFGSPPPKPEYVNYVPPLWAGPPDAEVVVVGESLSKSPMPGGWLPFTSRFTTQFGREFGLGAFKMGWTNVTTCDPRQLEGRHTVITCGKMASEWLTDLVLNDIERRVRPKRIIRLPHPSYTYRYHNDQTEHQISVIRQVASSMWPV